MTKTVKKRKASKPRRDFPLFLHATGQWAKKVRGKTHYFGRDATAAEAKWSQVKDDLLAGRTPRLHPADAPTLKVLVNKFLTSKRSLVDVGELSPVTWGHYYATCELLIKHLGKDRFVADLETIDFEKLRTALAKTRGAHALAGVIQRVRTLFKYGWDEGIIDKPVRFGTTFRKPSKKVMRKARHESGSRMIEAEDLRRLLDAAGTPMKAMILLGINCGFGQSDIGGLPMKAIDLKGGWVDFPRPKTAIVRRCPLWPETIEAIREAVKERPAPKSKADAALVFITKYGNRWVRVREREGVAGVGIDSVSLEFGKLLTATSLKRRGLGFYALRHTFRTVADGSKDQPAAALIMGHDDGSMANLYRERIDDERLRAVVNVVRSWLWPK